MSLRRAPLLPAFLVTLFTTTAASAAIVPVATADELLAAITAAKAGDEIVLASGTYALDGASCTADGTEAAPIVVRAAAPLGAVIEFNGLEGFKVRGAHWHFEDLDVRGVCANDPDCEHAFHVVGPAKHFTLRRSVLRDFNAQIKVNADKVNGSFVAADDGLIERCEFFDTHPRKTSNPVTKINIDGGARWIVRDTYLHDFHKDGGNAVSYGAFMKSGGADGVFERNLVVCSTTGAMDGARIGLSFGGGGTAPQFCAPAYDANTPCDVEHTGGTMRNNIVASCSDVAIYLNRSADTKIHFNTLVATSGIDFRFPTTNGTAHGNVLSGKIRNRDGGTHQAGDNLVEVALASFEGWYQAPTVGDLRLEGDVAALVGKAAAEASVKDDYCARARPAGGSITLGALEHSLGDCATVPPPGAMMGEGGAGGAGGAGTSGAGGMGTGSSTGAGGDGQGGASSGTGSGTGGGAQSGAGGDGATSGDAEGCGCRVAGAGGGHALGLTVTALVAFVFRRRRTSPR